MWIDVYVNGWMDRQTENATCEDGAFLHFDDLILERHELCHEFDITKALPERTTS
jgi:hypothetical protein